MTDAFRSQLEAAQEKVRRAEEEIAVLREDKTKLERRLSLTQKPLNVWLGGFLVAALAAGGTAGVMTVSETRAKAVREAEALAARRVMEERFLRAIEQSADELAKCRQESCRSPDSPPPLPMKLRPPCTCAPGDPLCACLDDDRPFDRGAALTALGEVNLRPCATEPGERSLHATVTFARNGSVSGAIIDSGNERITTAESACITRLLRNLHVPAFSGAPVNVGKTYTLAK